MTDVQALYAFDTHMCSLPKPRAFWGTVCESVGVPLTVTLTAADETLRREAIETQRDWIRHLRRINKDLQTGWDARQIRRLANSAAKTARDWLKNQLESPTGPYRVDRQQSTATIERQDLLDEAIPDAFFDFESPNGIRDKKIVVEAFAGNYNLLVSNNIRSIEVIGLTQWLREGPGRSMGIRTRILTPTLAVKTFRKAYHKPPEWLADVVAKASVTNPHNGAEARMEMAALIDGLAKRGIDDIRLHLRLLLENETVVRSALENVKQSGPSQSARGEADRTSVVAARLSRDTGLSESALLVPGF